MQVESLTEICRSCDSGDEDKDDIYFPTVQELIAGQGVSNSDSDNSDSDDSSESEFDDRPAQKKQKTNNSQHNRRGESPPICK
jgi:hypothetical protein